MTVEMDVIVDDLRWTEAMDLGAVGDRAAGAVLSKLGIDLDCEVALLATGDTRIATLNTDFRGKPAPTNVLSWPVEDLSPDIPGGQPLTPQPDDAADPMAGPHFLGDIALAYETCHSEALAAEKPLCEHATHLIVHAILHLLGYDHETEPDADLMEKLEVSILADMGYSSPYDTP